MSLKFLASLFIFIVFVYTILVVAQNTRRQRALTEKKEQEFWDREKGPTLSAKNPLMVWIM